MKKFLITAAVIMSTTTANAMSVEEVVSSKVMTYDVLSTTCKMLKKKSRYTKEEVTQLKAFATENKICGYKPEITVVETVVPAMDEEDTITSLKAIIKSKDLVISQLREKIAKLEKNSKTVPTVVTSSTTNTAPKSTPKPKVTGTGKWRVMSDKNPLDDSTTVNAILTASSGKGTYGGDVTLIARCQSNKTEVYVNWNSYMGSGGVYGSDTSYTSVRIGSGKTLKQGWSFSNNGKGTFAMQPIKLLRNIASDNNKLVVQATPFSESPITAVFDTAGARNALDKLSKTCNWKF